VSLQVWLQNVWSVWREVSIQSNILWYKNILTHYTSHQWIDITIEYIKRIYSGAEVIVRNQGSLIYLWARSTYFLVPLHQSSSYIKKWTLLGLTQLLYGQSRSEEFHSVCYIIIYHINSNRSYWIVLVGQDKKWSKDCSQTVFYSNINDCYFARILTGFE